MMDRFDSQMEIYDSRDFQQLPTEILFEIFQYLDYWDRIEASLVCRRWFAAIQDQHRTRRRLVFHRADTLDDDEEPVASILRGDQRYHSVSINNVEIGICFRFWHRYHRDIVELEIDDPEIKRKQFVDVVRHLTHLKTLKLINCRDLFMYNGLFSADADYNLLRVPFAGLTELCIAENRYLSDAFFNKIAPLMTRLESLNLTGCQISFHKGLYRKFYPNSSFQKGPSESILTYHFIHEFIASNRSTIRELNFSRTLIDGDALQKLTEIEGLKLRRLYLVSCDQLTNAGVVKLVTAQTALTHLDLSSCVRITDACLQSIAQWLPQLTVLGLRLCRAITDMGLVCLGALRQLEEIDVSGCEYVTGQGIEDLLKVANVKHFKWLQFSALSNIQVASVITLVQRCPNLTVLNLSSCRCALTNKSVQAIFKYSSQLRDLNLNFCDKITDAGLLGLDTGGDDDDKETADEERGRNGAVGFDPRKISLRSKAEQEIVDDAVLKNSMQTMCETQSKDMVFEQSIAHLKGLKHLKLTGCNKVTDVSLRYCFKFLDLRTVCLAKCHQISVLGIEAMTKTCPSIEVLNLSECQNIDDRAVKAISLQMNRLTELYIDRCCKLTDHSLDAIALNCKYIRVLDIRGCRSMCPEPRIRLQTVKTLRSLLVSKPGPYAESSFYPQAPPPYRL